MEENNLKLEECLDKINMFYSAISDYAYDNKTIISVGLSRLEQNINILRNSLLANVEETYPVELDPDLINLNFEEITNMLSKQNENLESINEQLENSLSDVHTQTVNFLKTSEEEKNIEPQNKDEEEKTQKDLESKLEKLNTLVNSNEFSQGSIDSFIVDKLEEIISNIPFETKKIILANCQKYIDEVVNTSNDTHKKFEENTLTAINSFGKGIGYGLESGILAIYEPENENEYNKNISFLDLETQKRKDVKKGKETKKINNIKLEFSQKEARYKSPAEYMRILQKNSEPYIEEMNSTILQNINQMKQLFSDFEKELENDLTLDEKTKDDFLKFFYSESHDFIFNFSRRSNIINHFSSDFDKSIDYWKDVESIAKGDLKFYNSSLLAQVSKENDIFFDAYKNLTNSDSLIKANSPILKHNLVKHFSPNEKGFTNIQSEFRTSLSNELKKYNIENSSIDKICDKYIEQIMNIYKDNFQKLNANSSKIIELAGNEHFELLKESSEVLQKVYAQNEIASQKITKEHIADSKEKIKDDQSKEIEKTNSVTENINNHKHDFVEKRINEREFRKAAELKTKEAERKKREAAEKKQRELNEKKEYFNNTFKEKANTTDKYYVALDQLSVNLDAIDDAFEKDVAILGLENTYSNIREIQALIVSAQTNAQKLSEVSNSTTISYTNEKNFEELENSREFKYFSESYDFSTSYFQCYTSNNETKSLHDLLQSELKENLVKDLYVQTQEAMKQDKIAKFESEKEKISSEKIGFWGRAKKEAIKQAKLDNLDLQIQIEKENPIPPIPEKYGMSDILCDMELYKDEQNIEEFSGKLSKFYNGIHEIANKHENSNIIENAHKKFEIEKSKNNLPISTEENQKYGFWNRGKKELEDLQARHEILNQERNRVSSKPAEPIKKSSEIYNRLSDSIKDLDKNISYCLGFMESVKENFKDSDKQQDKEGKDLDYPEL